ncbi:serine/threonine-protein phosphatase 2A 55 kDa regulatory subunit B alpha isoform-like [Sinocyclocheilus rhinocerous]|uniref:serine/threonine-protein phosphatase 2A 55 kDa regulatory subunit B alpha isoform-like n=1 Tax=Sinocyclocheilus rhinocerous TaxID=307959 RepID=UPI0007B81767|nr:PREDICTED: serine/threonine-protein phosphatase 2A 55 kDa regulatory subunit B alpha isoform-like [Sinocyclocheilus rhinocerous]
MDGDGEGQSRWCLSQVKGAVDDDVAEADIISAVEFNHSGELLATGDRGGRIVIFQQEQENKSLPQFRAEYNVYSTFQSHEPEFDYLKSLEIEEKINKIRWLPQKNAAHFLLSTNDKTIKLWKISERDKRPEGYNLKEEDGRYRHPSSLTTLRVPVFQPMDLMVEASPRRVYANAHTYHINSISVNSDNETYLSADDLRINLWHLDFTDRSFSILKKVKECFVTLISLSLSLSLSLSYQVHGYLRSKLCSLYENDCIFDKFECCWRGDDSEVMTGSYNNFFRIFNRDAQRDVTLEASWENGSPGCPLKTWRVCTGSRRKRSEIGVDCLDFSRKILYTSWHPQDNIVALATVNNLYIFQEKPN